MSDSAHSTQAARLRDAGLRATSPRIAILCLLERDRTHPDAEQIRARLRKSMPSLSLSTVYGTLEAFLAHGLLRKIQSVRGPLRVDGTASDHDHAVCKECGSVFDVPRIQEPHKNVGPTLPRGARLLNVHVEYEVICSQCADGVVTP